MTAPVPAIYVKCRICYCAMDSKHADAHLQTHIDAGDLIRAASIRERTER